DYYCLSYDTSLSAHYIF
nr:immunoglobulin light chain junction region [Macaca mulatta]MOV73037.1 immunoglobulin light chain junction region [Macaca mulatta]